MQYSKPLVSKPYTAHGGLLPRVPLTTFSLGSSRVSYREHPHLPPNPSFLQGCAANFRPAFSPPARHGSSCRQCSAGHKQLAWNTLVSCFMWVWLIPLASLGRILSLTCEDHDLRLVGIRTVLWLGLEPPKTSFNSLPVSPLEWETHQPSFRLCGLHRACFLLVGSLFHLSLSGCFLCFAFLTSFPFPSPPLPSSPPTLLPVSPLPSFPLFSSNPPPLPSPNSYPPLLLSSFSFPTQGLSL